jgi:hypothetical protein
MSMTKRLWISRIVSFPVPSRDLERFLTSAVGQFQRAIDTTGRREAPDRGVVIFCSDDHLTAERPEGPAGLYFDNGEGRQAKIRANSPAPGATRPCKDRLRAFAYPFGFQDGSQPGGTAVVLCSNWAGGALRSTKDKSEIGSWRTSGNLVNYPLGIEVVGGYLSYMIIHELMHVADMQQCKTLHPTTSRYGELTCAIGPAALPDGHIGELYGYQNIAGHALGDTGGTPPTVNNRQHNADSFAFLASGMDRSLTSPFTRNC